MLDNITREHVSQLLIIWIPRLVMASLILLIGLWLIKWVLKAMDRALDRSEVDETLKPFLNSLFGIVLRVLLFISIAGIFGVSIASFVAVLGAVAFAIGMALQGTLGHFASGVMLLALKPYKVGDFVTVADGRTGIVKEIQIFNTKILTLDNQVLFIPNGLVTSNTINNIFAEPKRRVDMVFGIGYDDDIDQAKDVIWQTIKDCPDILQEENNMVEVIEHADSSINFAVRVWCETENFRPTRYYMHEMLKKNFDKAEINIPYPQMDVHMGNLA